MQGLLKAPNSCCSCTVPHAGTGNDASNNAALRTWHDILCQQDKVEMRYSMPTTIVYLLVCIYLDQETAQLEECNTMANIITSACALHL